MRILTAFFLLTFSNLWSQIPKVELKSIDGKTFKTDSIGIRGPIIWSFWATWCSPCKKELSAISEVYEDWQSETGVTLIAVSIDDQKTLSSVPVYTQGKGWDFLILLDPNSDFKRLMGVNNVPHTFLTDSTGKIVYSHNNYSPGDEEILYNELIKLKNQ